MLDTQAVFMNIRGKFAKINVSGGKFGGNPLNLRFLGKKKTDLNAVFKPFLVVAGAGFEPTTFGL